MDEEEVCASCGVLIEDFGPYCNDCARDEAMREIVEDQAAGEGEE